VLLAILPVASCYTGPVNMRPTVDITRPAARIFRGQMTTYYATVSDPDNDSHVLQWAWTAAECPTNARSPEAWPKTWKTSDAYMLGAPETNKTFCVWAKATDPYGAAAVDVWTEVPANHLPEVHIDVEQPAPDPGATAQTFAERTFPVHTFFRLSGERTVDADETDALEFTWLVKEGPTDGAHMEPCPSPSDQKVTCFTADLAGDYLVELRVGDGAEMAAVTKPLFVRPGHAPVAKLERVSPLGPGPFPLGTPLRVSAVGSTDEDQGDLGRLQFNWEHDFKDAPATADDFGPCADEPSDAIRCFTGDARGEYRVSVTVYDGTNFSGTATLKEEILDDAMPCLGITDPDLTTEIIVPKPNKPKEFTVVTVKDDLDPFPNPASLKNVAKFDWLVSKSWSGQDFELVSRDGTLNQFSLSPGPLGAEMRVRVQIRDRDARRSQLAFERCTDDKCFSGTEEDRCFQRWTWKVKFVQ
jgi:hypothetical protein